tara:strand:+ start:153 stop:551 length:399 start_codon:yes stop_codon:yes gene_type:complete
MIFIAIIAVLIFTAIAAAIITPLMQYAFKLTEGQRNNYSDSFKICFYATFASALVTEILPLFITTPFMINIWSGLGTLVGLIAFTYFIAKELGDLKKSFLIALLMEALIFLLAIAIGLLLIAIGLVTVAVNA